MTKLIYGSVIKSPKFYIQVQKNNNNNNNKITQQLGRFRTYETYRRSGDICVSEQWTLSSFVLVTSCYMFSTKSLAGPILTYSLTHTNKLRFNLNQIP